MHLLPEVDCGPKAWTVLKELHAPTSVVATLMLERELSALRLSEREPVQPVLDKMRDLYTKLATAGITYPEQTKCLKMLSLLPESWIQFTSGLSLPQNQSLWTLEWVRTKTLEEDFRRRQLRGGDDGSSCWSAPINEVCSASGHALKVAGAGRAAFKEADGKPVVLHDILLVPDLKANLLSLRMLAKAGVSTSTDAARTYKKLLEDVRAAPINELCSASGHALKVAGAGRAAFKGAERKPVVLHDVLFVPDLMANFISLRKLAKARVSTNTDGARTYKGQAGEGSASQGECNAVGGVGGACGNALIEAAREGWSSQL
ncbi:unnamed protein product [Closterium sp. NIES-53]